MTVEMPPDEDKRLKTLRDLNILDTVSEAKFDELTQLAAQICRVPIGLISLIDEQRQWFKSCLGLNVNETPRDIAFCAHGILQPNGLLEVPDALLDRRFADNPLVLEDPKIRFYAGAPLIAPNGHALGALCVIDHTPRQLSEAQKHALIVLSRITVEQIILRRNLQLLKNSEGLLQSQNTQLEEKVEMGVATLEQEIVMRNELEMLSRQILDMAWDGVINLDQHGKVIYWNPEAERIFGYSTEYAHNRDIVELIIPAHHHGIIRERMQQLLKAGVGKVNHRRFEISALRADGSKVPVEVAVMVLQRYGEYFLNGFVRDLTEHNKTIDELRISAITFNSQDAIIITDAEQKILRVNQKFIDITGYTLADVIGLEPSLLSSSAHNEQFYRGMWRTIEAVGSWEGEIWDRRKNADLFPMFITITAIRDANSKVTNFVFSFSDITATKRDADAIHKLVFFDPLTRLPNRRALLDNLSETLLACASSTKNAALLFVDLDNFKEINDTLGHQLGDKMLVQTAQRLSNCVRNRDTIARIGGDEFVVILQDLGVNLEEARAKTSVMAEKILAALNNPYTLSEHEIHSSASIGATFVSHHDTPVQEILKQADIAMYQAKRSGRNKLCFFDPEMQENVTLQARVSNALHSAIQNHEFELYYQLQVDAELKSVGAEALIRWEHPQLGIVSPADFIPLAEESGLILPIGLWVLNTACAQLKRWQASSQTSELSIAVNISPRQFHQTDFVETVLTAIAKADISPNSLKLELTETLILDNVSATIEKMNQLKHAGVEFALDDFGTGYSSLSYLTQLPLSQLKIDQSFVRNIGLKENDDIIVQTIIGMANSLGIKIIAEGVESEAQHKFLEKLGCPLFQGYLFGQPMPIAEFEQLLE